jgi:DNA adenine methylase
MSIKPGMIPQAFPYQGSKRKQAPIIVACVPNGTRRLVEPFAGSGAISVATAWAGRASAFWLNDTHAALMALWRRIIDEPDALAEDYRKLWGEQEGDERRFYDKAREEFNQTQRPDLLLYLLARCVKAAIRYNRNGGFNNSPDNRRKGMRPGTMRGNIRLVSRILGPQTKITSLDYPLVLAEARPTDLVYMDPPYQGVCKDRDCRYVGGVDYDAFVAELGRLNDRGVPYVVSYDGRTGDKAYGMPLPKSLGLFHAEVLVGRSTQATLLGRDDETYESLYVSPAALEKLGGVPPCLRPPKKPAQLLFG